MYKIQIFMSSTVTTRLCCPYYNTENFYLISLIMNIATLVSTCVHTYSSTDSKFNVTHVQSVCHTVNYACV